MQKNVLEWKFICQRFITNFFFVWMTYHRQAFDKTMNESGYLLPFQFLSKAFDCTMPQEDTVNIWNLPNIDGKRVQWKRISRKQSTRCQHLSRLKASAFFSLQNISC
jgi:hypothetical protein